MVFGGTGSIGSEIVSQLLNYNPKTIRILSNSENELWECKLRFQQFEGKLRFLLGDIRNYERVKRATKEVDYVFNAAAIKHVPFSEYNPMEAINVNIHGLENIIEACFECNVKKMLNISTDKAVNPISVMGATKMLGERLCISRELAKGSYSTIISCVRFGNVLGSRGSIIPLVKEQLKYGTRVTLTDENMRRYFMSISDAARLVLKSMYIAKGGEIFVLKMPVIRIKDLLEVLIEMFAPVYGKDPETIVIERIGSRRGEKLEEKLLTRNELNHCYENNELFAVLPPDYMTKNHLFKDKSEKLIKVEVQHYTSMNENPIIKEEIKQILDKLNLLNDR